MQNKIRHISDNIFTYISTGSILILVAALLLFLVPMCVKGVKAVVFSGTVEFRKMQAERYNRIDLEALNAEIENTNKVRDEIYAIMDDFSHGIDTSTLVSQVKGLYRDYGEQLRFLGTDKDKYTALRADAKLIRDEMLAAFETTDVTVINEHLNTIESYRSRPEFKETAVSTMLEIAAEFRQTAQSVDLSHRDEYLAELEQVKAELHALFGPRPGESRMLAMESYGATRWDIARKHLHNLIWQEKWLATDGSENLQKTLIRRDDPEKGAFAGTELARLFPLVESKLNAALNPRLTFYWQYFIDDSTPGHYFGGVGPEIIGTLLLTLLAVLIAVPLGVISAAYLIEYAGDNPGIRLIRICINTLAGVPSIVYGLFGLAFFVNYVTGEPCILSAALTLALLILPVIIRASEEAIRAVPRTYREAAMGLGAGKFRTFVTVTLPAAGPGILTGIILSLSRAAGETAPILFTGAVALGPVPDFSGKWWLQSTRALSYGCHDITVGDKLAAMVPHNQFGMVMTLIILVLCLNIAAIVIRSRMSKKLRGQ